MLFPIGDDDRRLSRPAYATHVLIALNLIVFVLLQGFGTNDSFVYGYSVIPKEIVTGSDLVSPQTVRVGGEAVSIPQAPGPSPIYLTLISSMFMHAGILHLLGNLLYLWIFGDNIEHRFGTGVFVAFYLICGLAGGILQVFLNPEGLIPNLGASGAISGVLGAYIVLFPRNKVQTVFFFVVVSVPAILVIGLWIALQLVEGFGSLATIADQAGGVAYGAHIGGFAAGVVLAFALRVLISEEKPSVISSVYPADHSRRYW